MSEDDFILKARAAWNDSFKISKLQDAITSLQSENDALTALVSELVKAAEPFMEALNHLVEGEYNSAEIADILTGTGLNERDLRSLSEAVARARAMNKEGTN